MKYFLIITFILYVLILSFFSREGFPQNGSAQISFPYLSERPLTEDGFYSLKIAWNIGSGKGIIYNYNKPVTGFQPLFVFTISIISFLVNSFGGDKYTFARLVILFHGLISILFGFIVYKISLSISNGIDKRKLFIISMLIVLFNFKIFLNFFNGLETGLYLVLLGTCYYYSLKLNQASLVFRQKIFIGILVGVTVLARIDFSLVVIIYFLLLLIKKYLTLRDAFLIALTALLIVLPWFLYIYITSGSIIQSSAIVQTNADLYVETLYRFDQFFFSVLSNFIPFYHTGLTQTLFFYPVALVIIYFIFKYFIAQKIKLKNFNTISLWIISMSVLTLIYLFFTAVPYFFFRYLSIISIITLPILAIVIAKLFEHKKKYFYLVTIGIMIYFFSNIIYYFHTGKEDSSLAKRTGFLINNFPDSIKIGIAQSGIAGYFLDNVVNLDGKVNLDALSAIRSGRYIQYINNSDVEVLIEWEEWFDIISDKSFQQNWKVYPAEIGDGKSKVFVRN